MNFFIIEFTFVFAFKAMNQYVKYNSDYHVLICCQHGYGLAPDYIERHFRESHKTIPLETRRDIVSYSKTLDLWQPMTEFSPKGDDLGILLSDWLFDSMLFITF